MDITNNPAAINKLYILYALANAGEKISDTRLLAMIGELALMTCFELDCALAELCENGLVSKNVCLNGVFYAITETGASTLDFFEKELRDSIRKRIVAYIDINREEIIMESQLFAEYIRIGEDQYRVNLKIIENDVSTFEISFLAESKAEADRYVKGWRRNSQRVYSGIFEALLKQPEESGTEAMQ